MLIMSNNDMSTGSSNSSATSNAQFALLKNPSSASAAAAVNQQQNSLFSAGPRSANVSLFTVEQLQALQRQMQQQQQFVQQQQHAIASQQHGSSPFMVLAQIPISATQLANQMSASNLGNPMSFPEVPVANQQEFHAQHDSTNQWAAMLQPTPINPNRSVSQSPKPDGSQLRQPQQQQQDTSSFLQQLMRNVQAAQQQQQQQQQQQPPAPAPTQKSFIESAVEPLGSELNNANNDMMTEDNAQVDIWKHMWDDDVEDKFYETKMMASNKRKFSLTGNTMAPTQSLDSSNTNNSVSAGNDEDWAPTPLSDMQRGLNVALPQPPCQQQQGAQARMQIPIPMLQQQINSLTFPNQTLSMPQGVQFSSPQLQVPNSISVREQEIRPQPTFSISNPLSSPQLQTQHSSTKRLNVASKAKSSLTETSIAARQVQEFQSVDGHHQAKTEQFLLPSTMMPPTVLTSILPSSQSSHSTKKVANKKKVGNKSSRVESPQDVLERLLSSRGYGNNLRIKAETSRYDTMPSPLQLASFGTELVKAVHTSDVSKLSSLLSTGLSPNPCNQFRDSLVDLVCKRANWPIFKCLVEHGCDLRVCDGFGRTPLHHCCWAGEFSAEIADTILRRDWQQLLLEDKRGQTPLEYVRAGQASDWIDFLEDNKDAYFPVGGSIPEVQSLRDLRADGYLPNPPNALQVQLASAISSGQLTPEELETMDPQLRARFQ